MAFDDEIHVHYGFIFVKATDQSPELGSTRGGQANGICGAAVPGVLALITGLHTGAVPLRVEYHDDEPGVGASGRTSSKRASPPTGRRTRSPLSITSIRCPPCPRVTTGSGTAPREWTPRTIRPACPANLPSTAICCSCGLRRLGLRRNDIEFSDDYFVGGDSESGAAAGAFEHLLGLDSPPTALVVANNIMTVGVLTAAKRLGVRIAEDIALTCFDDPEWAGLVSPGLTTMAQPVKSLGIQAAELALSRMVDPTLPPRRVVLRPTFMHRESCGCPPAIAAAENAVAPAVADSR